MDGITTIISADKSIDDIINALKAKSITVPAWDNLNLDYNPLKHKILSDNVGRKDKIRKDGSIEKAARITFGLERLLVSRITEFMFAIPVKRIYHNTEGNETRQQIAKAIEAVYKHARINAENIKRGISYFAACELLTIWYTVESPNTLYGFNSKSKLKCKTYSPMDGVTFYPLLDDYGDMIAMSFGYSKTVNDDTVTYFETYTSNYHYKWRSSEQGWENAINPEPIEILKIPAIYGYRSTPIYYGLTDLRNEMEYTISRHSDIIAYNAAPVLKVVGKVMGKEDKGEEQRVIRVESNGDVGYVSWSQAIDAFKYHVETMLNMFWTQSQMPDISFANMQKLGNIGFDARQTLLTDAHLKVGDESGAWLEFFERETNVIKAFLRKMNVQFESEMDNVEVEHVITPFIQQDESAEIDKRMKANGGLPIESQRESIIRYGRSNDPDATMEQIQEEEAKSAKAAVGNIMDAYE